MGGSPAFHFCKPCPTDFFTILEAERQIYLRFWGLDASEMFGRVESVFRYFVI